MNKIFFAGPLFAVCAPAFAAVGVAITVGQPGFYGQVDIAGAPAPELVYPQPVLIQQGPQYVAAPPIYLHVPPGHERNWKEHCAEYRACGRPVYFVKDDWYNKQYVPHYKKEHGEQGHGHDHD